MNPLRTNAPYEYKQHSARRKLYSAKEYSRSFQKNRETEEPRALPSEESTGLQEEVDGDRTMPNRAGSLVATQRPHPFCIPQCLRDGNGDISNL